MKLVLAPSLGTTFDSLWQTCATNLPTETEVVGYDLPGHARPTSVDDATSLTVEDLAIEVLDSNSGRFDFAGDSVGGAIGLSIALKAPDRIRSLTILCSAAKFGEPNEWLARAELAATSGTSVLRERASRVWFGAGFMQREPLAAERLLDTLVRVDQLGYAAVCRAIASFDIRSDLGRITTPVLAVAGTDDQVTPPPLIRNIAASVANGTFEELPGVGHLAPAETPETVARLITAHTRAQEE